jgi:chemotaxis protein MotB
LLPILMKLPEPISIAGYTDAAPYSGVGRSNWDLSTERANATRKVLTDAGLPDGRIRDVAGHADRDLLLPADPLAAANRRVAIVLLRRQ